MFTNLAKMSCTIIINAQHRWWRVWNKESRALAQKRRRLIKNDGQDVGQEKSKNSLYLVIRQVGYLLIIVINLCVLQGWKITTSFYEFECTCILSLLATYEFECTYLHCFIHLPIMSPKWMHHVVITLYYMTNL